MGRPAHGDTPAPSEQYASQLCPFTVALPLSFQLNVNDSIAGAAPPSQLFETSPRVDEPDVMHVALEEPPEDVEHAAAPTSASTMLEIVFGIVTRLYYGCPRPTRGPSGQVAP